MKPQRHTLVVEVVSEVDRGQRQMQNRLHRWLECYGHTASAFGFQFRSVGVLTGKHISPSTGKRKDASLNLPDQGDSDAVSK